MIKSEKISKHNEVKKTMEMKELGWSLKAVYPQEDSTVILFFEKPDKKDGRVLLNE